MEDGIYHFDGIHSVAVTEDGKHLTLYVNGAGGLWGLRLPTVEIPAVIAKLSACAAEGRKRSGDQTLRLFSIQEIRIIDSPVLPDRAIVSIALDPVSPPLALDLSKTELVEIARQLLQAAGEIPIDRPSSIQ